MASSPIAIHRVSIAIAHPSHRTSHIAQRTSHIAIDVRHNRLSDMRVTPQEAMAALPRAHSATLQLVMDTLLAVSQSAEWFATVALLLGCAIVNGRTADAPAPLEVERLTRVMLRNWSCALLAHVA